jgi:hypothetical protein
LTRGRGGVKQEVADGERDFRDEILSRTKGTHQQSKEMPKGDDYGRNHRLNLIGTLLVKLVSKSFILRVREVLTRDRLKRFAVLHSL